MTEVSNNFEIKKSITMFTTEGSSSEVSSEELTSVDMGSAFTSQETRVIEPENIFSTPISTETNKSKSENSTIFGNQHSNNGSDVQISKSEQNISEHVDADSMRTLSRNEKLAKLKVTKEEVANAKAFLDKTSAEIGVSPADIPQNEKDLYMALSIAYQKGRITRAEFIRTVEEFGSEEVSKAVKENIPQGAETVDEERMEKIRNKIRHFGKMRTLNDMSIANQIRGKNPEETKRLQEEYFLKSAESTDIYHKELMQTIKDSLPKDCTDDVAASVIELSDEYVKARFDSIESLAISKKFSKTFMENLKKSYNTIWDRIITAREKFVNSCKRYFRHRVFIKKLELKQRKEIADKKLEEAQVAQKNAKIAKEKANSAKANIKKMLAWFGLSDLKKKDKIKFVKHESPRLAIDAKYAILKQKRAEELEYDANVTKRLAEQDVAWAEKSLQFAIAERDTFFALTAN